MPDASILPWTRRHVATVAAQYAASVDDLWDEAVTAILRALVYFQPQDPATYRSSTYAAPLPAAKSFKYYAQIAVNRACWRYVVRGHVRRLPTVELLEDDVTMPSAEEEAIARETPLSNQSRTDVVVDTVSDHTKMLYAGTNAAQIRRYKNPYLLLL